MAETDALGSACKKLGIGAKVYWDTDRTKYTLEEDGSVTAEEVSEEELKAEREQERIDAEASADDERSRSSFEDLLQRDLEDAADEEEDDVA